MALISSAEEHLKLTCTPGRHKQVRSGMGTRRELEVEGTAKSNCVDVVETECGFHGWKGGQLSLSVVQ